MRAFIAARFAAMVSGVGVDWFLVANRRRSCAALGGPVKARPTSSTNPFTIIKPGSAWVRNHNAMMKTRADWPVGI